MILHPTMDDIARFLGSTPYFQMLPADELLAVAATARIEYFAAGTAILRLGGRPAEFLYVVQRGSVDLLRDDDHDRVQLLDTLGDGEVFGHPSLLRGREPSVTVRSREETLCYLVPGEVFRGLIARYPEFARLFTLSVIERMRERGHRREDDSSPLLFRTRLRELVRRAPVIVAATLTVRETARLMREQNISCVLIEQESIGIVTDRDFRNRVVAEDLPGDTPLARIMTMPATALPADSLVFEGLVLMTERGCHHLPVTENGKISGLVTRTDILRQQSRSPVFLPRLLERARTQEDLRHYAAQTGETVRALLTAGARMSDIGRVVAVAHDALQGRLCRNAEAALGPPPVPYAWLVLGSGGRLEQTHRTDQDNALVYDDAADGAAADYFARLAAFVVDGLCDVGFPRCPGDIMATNPKWRQPLRSWKQYFSDWIERPEEEALLRAAIFFDFRQIHGALRAEDALHQVVARAQGNRIFLGRLARAALRNAPPLGFFRQLVGERRGDRGETIDLKMKGTAMIVDLARLAALEAGATATNTRARLRLAGAASAVGEAGAEELVSAFESIGMLRLRHQEDLIKRGQPPDNLLPLKGLSSLQRRELKEALQAVAHAQESIGLAFQVARIS